MKIITGKNFSFVSDNKRDSSKLLFLANFILAYFSFFMVHKLTQSI